MDVKSIPDSMIIELPPRPSGVIDYRLGNVSVSYRGGGKYICMTCKGIDRYRGHISRGCAHCVRVARFREERQAELNVMKADPALEVPIA